MVKEKEVMAKLLNAFRQIGKEERFSIISRWKV
jgi:hypothetical protein